MIEDLKDSFHESLPQLSSSSSSFRNSTQTGPIQRIVAPASYFKSQASKSISSVRNREHLNDSLPMEASEISFDDIRNLSALVAIKGRNSKVVSGSQYRHLSRDQQSKCEQCEQFDKMVKKLRETIRALRFKLERFEEKYNDLKLFKSNTTSADGNGSNVKLLSFDSGLFDQSENVGKNCESCERNIDENTKMKRMVSYERTANEGLRKAFVELRQHSEEELKTEKDLSDNLRSEVNRLKDILAAQSRENEQLSNSLANYKEQLQKTETKFNDATIRLNLQQANAASDIENLREINRLKIELSAADTTNKTLSTKVKDLTNLNATTEETLAKVQEANTGLQTDLAQLNVALWKKEEEAKRYAEMYATEKKRTDVLEDLVKTIVMERDRLASTLKKTEHELASSRSKVASLEAEGRGQATRLEELTRKMLVESENFKKAIEKAVSASVRLCVVAPTVNVHVAEKKLKFKAGLSEAALKDFLKSEVLDKYSFLYKQKSENTAPNGSNLESWLQKMLAQMQTSIQNHVNSAMDGAEL